MMTAFSIKNWNMHLSIQHITLPFLHHHAPTETALIPCFCPALLSFIFKFCNLSGEETSLSPTGLTCKAEVLAVRSNCLSWYTNITNLLFPILTSRAFFSLCKIPEGKGASDGYGVWTWRQIQNNYL